MNQISIKYKILIPVVLVLIASIATTTIVNVTQSSQNSRDNIVSVANASLKAVVLTSEVAVSGANIMKIKSRDMQTLFKSSEALFIKIDGTSNKIPASIFAPEQPPKKINYTYKSKQYSSKLDSLSQEVLKIKEPFLIKDGYLLVKTTLNIKNGGYVYAIFDANIIDIIYDNTITSALKTAVPLLIISILVVLYVSQLIINVILNLQNGLSKFFAFLNKEIENVDDIKVIADDEIGLMTREINKNINMIKVNLATDDELINDVSKIASRITSGHLGDRITSDAHSQSLIKLKIVINGMLDSLQDNIDALMNILSEFANHKYTSRADTSVVEGSILNLSKDINVVGDTITEMLQENMKFGTILEKNSTELSNSVKNISDSANHQATSVEETAAALEQITNNIKSNSKHIKSMYTYGDEVKSAAQSGQELADKTVTAMNSINQQTQSITEAISIIDQIAFQTNILSLNAAVEAATAGEAGKGFAVVAQEVRNLASRSAEAAKEIKSIVEIANDKTAQGKDIAFKMQEGYKFLNTDISKTIELIQQVTTSSEEQEKSITQINDSISDIDKATQQNAIEANNTNTIAKETKDIAHIIVSNVEANEFKRE